MNTKRNKRQNVGIRLALTALVIGLLVGVPQAMAQSCCDKATAKGAECTHPCCVEANLIGKICFKCNSDKATSCCDKAEGKGTLCAHPCCTAAYNIGKVCFKCNSDKVTSCCDKAEAKGGACSHPCCVEAASINSVCFKCNKSATAVPFRGDNLMAFLFKGDQSKSKWQVGHAAVSSDDPKMLSVTPTDTDGVMVNLSSKKNKSIDCYTKAKFGDCRIELEVMVPKGSNSGIYVMGEYEIQVYDSYGVENVKGSDMGGIYGASPPAVNASKAPGEWQKFVIDFKAPRFDTHDDHSHKTANATVVKVTLNGKVIHENVEMEGPTPAGVTGKEAATGPLMFQGDHGSVAYRNIRITDLAGKL